jgi:hypothetical protein
MFSQIQYKKETNKFILQTLTYSSKITFFVEPLSISFTEKEIQDSLSALPIWGRHESVSVKGSYSQALSIPIFTYEITFNTTRGKC